MCSRLALSSVVLLAISLGTSCHATDDARPLEHAASEVREGWSLGFTEGRRYRVMFRSNPAPIPLAAPFDLEIEVSRGSGLPMIGTKVRIDVEATQPHAELTRQTAQIHPLGPGVFRATGLVFRNQGKWVLTVSVYVGTESGRAVFDVSPRAPL